jgi:MOSC domain-containing protein YiiM
MGAHLVSVNVGRGVGGAWAGRLSRTAIDKRPVAAAVAVHRLGLEGDEVVDTEFHGGVHKAVYAFASEDLDLWAGRLGVPLPPGTFGENLTTAGIEVNEALVGEHWRIGTAVLSPADVRIPCQVFRAWLGRHGVDTTGWSRRFVEEGRPGPYLRIVREGELRAGDEIVVEHRPAHGVTVARMFRALTTERSLLPELLGVEGLPEAAYAAARRHLRRTGHPAPAGDGSLTGG